MMRILVTGGGGFLGAAIVNRLLEHRHDVRILARGDYPTLRASGVDTVRGDITRLEDVQRAAEGVEGIFHVAALAGVFGRRSDFERTNVDGTRHVLEICHEQGIRYLVYTSSPSVVMRRGGLEGVDESVTYPTHFDADYPRTKALAEQMVLKASGPRLTTVSLRPHLIWGPGDPHLLPRLIARARAGRLRQIGSSDCLIDSCYIDNAAHAHLLAFSRLLEGAGVGGRAYFITNGEPMGCWTLINRLLEAAGAPQVRATIPAGVAYAMGAGLEAFYRVMGRTDEPLMTRFVARELSSPHYFNITAARRDLGYEPEVSLEEGLRRLARWYRQEESSHMA